VSLESKLAQAATPPRLLADSMTCVYVIGYPKAEIPGKIKKILGGADMNPARHAPNAPTRTPQWAARLLGAFLVASLGVLSACAPKRLKSDFTGFEQVYAETSNREVLLNLARLANHDPTYFFKLGQISTSYRMQASLTAFGSFVPQGLSPGGSNVTAGAMPMVNYESNPAFTFIPVNDDTNAQLLLKPVPPETFYVLYQQGWRLDQLFRLMVDRVELTTNTGNACITEAIHNSPEDLGSYVRFLRVSAILYFLQKRGYLLLRGENQFVPYDKNSYLTETGNELAPTEIFGGQKVLAPTITAKDFNEASAKNSVWERVEPEGGGQAKWRLGTEVFNPAFLLNPPFVSCENPDAAKKISEDDKLCPDIKKIEEEIKQYHEISDNLGRVPDLLPIVLSGLLKGFSIEGRSNLSTKLMCQTVPLRSTSGVLQIHLVMRSLIGLMAAAAQEQDLYDAMKPATPVPADPLLNQKEQEGLTFATAVPMVEQLPLLRLKWLPEGGEPSHLLIPPLIYKGSTYIVADQSEPCDHENLSCAVNQSWNRDVFRLISQLSAQVTVDISKFPLPEVLQLRTQ